MQLNVVPARRGWGWARDGLRLFWKQPIGLAGVFFLFMAVMSIATLVPVLGSLIAMALLPAATVGMMAASRAVRQSQFPLPAVLVTAFRQGPQSTRSMLVLGALYAVVFVLMLGMTTWVDGGTFAKLYLLGGTMTPELMQSEAFQRAAWVAMLLYAPLSMLFWFAPALVHWHHIPPVKSLFFSWVACWRNLSAFLLYGLAWAGIGVGVGMLLTALLSALGQPGMVMALFVPVMMAVVAMFFTSIDQTFQDVFTSSVDASTVPVAPSSSPGPDDHA